jgi:hypothetical protein
MILLTIRYHITYGEINFITTVLIYSTIFYQTNIN